MKLFSIKVGVTLENVTHESELRRGEARVKIAVLHLKIAPFDKTLAAAMPDGVRRRLFDNNGEVDPLTLRHDFPALVERQVFLVAAAPDVDATRALDQVRVYHVRASRGPMDKAFTLRMRASFGPLSADDWAFIDLWRGTQRFVRWEPAQQSLEFLGAEEAEDTDDEAADDTAKTPLPFTAGTCTHGCRVGEACDDCPEKIATVTPPPQDDRDTARTLPRRHAAGTKKPQAPRARTH